VRKRVVGAKREKRETDDGRMDGCTPTARASDLMIDRRRVVGGGGGGGRRERRARGRRDGRARTRRA
jgi:hypothetical protein